MNKKIGDILKLNKFDDKLIESICKVDITTFLPGEQKEAVYRNVSVPIGKGQIMEEITLLAQVLNNINLNENDNVLEIGTGTGYFTSVMANICRNIVSYEIIPSLYERSKKNINSKNVKIKLGNGLNDNEKYNKIYVSGSMREIPEILINKLNDNGIIIIPLGSPYFQILTKITKINGEIRKEPIIECLFIPLKIDKV